MTPEQAYIAAIIALAGVIGVLFNQLIKAKNELRDLERQRLEFVTKKLEDTEAREATHKTMLQTLIDLGKSQTAGALPPAPDPRKGYR